MQSVVGAMRQNAAAEAVWRVEHEAGYTSGTAEKPHGILAPGSVPISHVGRGGQWTWHGPGQRVAYVMLDLGARNPDVRAYVQALEAWIIDTLASFGVTGQRRDGHPGIWVAGDGQLDKIAAIGVRISRWVSWHGIAINLEPDLSAFDRIVPCGVRDGGVTSLAAQGISCDMAQLDTALAACFERHFPYLPA